MSPGVAQREIGVRGGPISAIPEIELAGAGLEAGHRDPRLRLLILTASFEIGEVGQMILTLSPRLQREGFEIVIASLGRWGPLGEELEDRGLRAVALGMAGLGDPRGAGRFLALVRRERTHIIHAHLFPANLTARILGRLADVPVVITSHDDADRWMGLGRRLAERATAPLSDAVITCSEAGRRYVIGRYGFGPGVVRTVRGAVEMPEGPDDPVRRETVRRELGAGAQDLLIGTVGRLEEPWKGQSIFLAAARLLAQDLNRVRFVLVGAGPSRRRLEARAAEEGISHRTVFAGLRRDIPDVMRSLDLLVEPSLWEGFGLAALEAMAVGTPVVATAVGGLPEAIVNGESGVLVPPGDARALAAACGALLRDRERARHLAETGRERAATLFRVDRLVVDMASLYRGCFARARARTERGPIAPGSPA